MKLLPPDQFQRGELQGFGYLQTNVVRRAGQAQRGRGAAVLDASLLTEPDEFLVNAAVRMIDAITDDPHTWRPILLAPNGTPEMVRARIDRDRERVRRQIGHLLEVGLALRGGPKLDVEVVSHAVVAVLEHFGRLLLEDPRRFETDRLVAAIRGLLNAIEAHR